MASIAYQAVAAYRTHVGPCPVCGKSVKRSRKFEFTVNPWNRNPDGSVCTYEEVLDQAHAAAEAWVPDFTHRRCKGGAT